MDFKTTKPKNRNSCRACLIAGTVIVIIGCALGFGLYYGLKDHSDCGCSVVEEQSCLQFTCNNSSALGNYCSESKLGIYRNFSISTDSEPCAGIGKRTIEKGGNAVDSIISVLLCMGVTIPESMGLGGGSLLLVYNSSDGSTHAIDAREKAPSAANATMFNETGHINSVQGPLAIAVPGELSGYWHIFENYGSGRLKPELRKVTWSDLFVEAIGLCENGFNVSEHLSSALKQNEKHILGHQDLIEVYVNPKTEQIYKKGETMIQSKLGHTLRRIADSDNPIKLWKEEIAKQIVEDINKVANDWLISPIITVQDFENYSAISRPAVTTNFELKNITLHSFPLPGSGAVLSFILNVMQRFTDLYPSSTNSIESSTLFYHRLVETYKFAFAKRMHLGDADHGFDEDAREVVKLLTSDEFVDKIKNEINDQRTYESSSDHYDARAFLHEDHGTAHVSVVDPEGNAVSVTTTVNSYFGSKVMSSSTGILLNNEMDDFNTGAVNDFDIPPSDSNLIQPGKRPLSSMSPSVFTDPSGLRLVIGGSGGPKITTAVASVAIRNLWFGEDIRRAIDGQRLHHQLFPDKIVYEKCFPKEILCNLEEKGHHLERLKDSDRGAIIMAISKVDGRLFANSDYRKGGTVEGQ